MKTQRYDLIIVGGGMVGATLACALGDSPLRIALVEHQSPSTRWPVPDFDIRVSAITRATENVFRAVGAWPGMEQRRVCPYQHMRVWDAGGNGEIHFDCAGIGEANLGHIIENSVIQAALWERAGQFGNIARICPATPAQLAWDNRQASLMLSQGITLASPLLVGADGGRSWVREQAGIDCLGWDYQQTAVVATIKTPAGHQDTAWQRFLPDGPLAFLPLPGAYCSIVWSTRPAHAETLLALSDADFLHTLQQNIGDVLGELEGVGPRGAFPLRLSHTREYVRPRLALIGDAAHSIHPLAGQGVNLGVADAASLVQVITQALKEDKDIGALQVLRRYERWRKGENLSMMFAMDAFKRLFGNEHAAVRWARNTGLNLTDHLPPLKQLIIRQAMGLSGELPDLARQVHSRD